MAKKVSTISETRGVVFSGDIELLSDDDDAKRLPILLDGEELKLARILIWSMNVQ